MPEELSGEPEKEKDENVAADYLDDLGLTWEILRGKKVLDLGAGGASFARIAKEKGVKVTSLDIRSKAYREESLELGETAFVKGSGHNLPFNNETFDLVVAKAVMHSPLIAETRSELERVLSETKRVLRKGGEFRFGPGAIEARELSQVQIERLIDLVIKGSLSDEERKEKKELDRLAEEDILEGSPSRKSHFKGLSGEEKAERLKKWSLKLLHSIDPNITVRPGASWRETERSFYFTMKKKG